MIHFNWLSSDVSDAIHQVTARGLQKNFQGVAHYVCVGLLDVLLWFLECLRLSGADCAVTEAVGSRLRSKR